MAVIRKPANSSTTRTVLGKTMLIISLCLVFVSITLFTYTIVKKNSTRPTTSHKIVSQPTVTISNTPNEVKNVGRTYMDALIQQHYEQMWTILNPQVRTTWPNEQTFIAYWKGRFRGYKLRSYSFGNVTHHSYWVNPETMQQFPNVEVMPISLQITSLLPQARKAQLAPQFNNPDQIYRNLPFVVQSLVTSNTSTPRQWCVLEGGPGDLEAPILPPLDQTIKTVAVPILMYHHIVTPVTKDPLTLSLSVTPAMFSLQLDYLKKSGYHTITMNQLMDALYYGAPLPKKPIILTFDDGYDDAYTHAYPILKAHGYSGIFYIITGKVGWGGQASWPQLREMLANGMQMGSHTIHHVDMGDVYQASPMEAAQEVEISQTAMQGHLGIVIQHFCYPNGGPFKGYNLLLQQEVMNLLAKYGYTDATTDPGPTGYIQNSDRTLALLRIRVDGRYPLQTFIESLPA